MVANHMLQLVALTAMEPPIAFDADAVREQKVQVFRSIRPMSVEEVARGLCAVSMAPAKLTTAQCPVTARSLACAKTPQQKPTSHCSSISIIGGGLACRFSCVLANGSRDA